jgi:Glycosyl hydrolases family 18
MVGTQPMALARKHSALAGPSLALTAALTIAAGSVNAAASTATAATTASHTPAKAAGAPGDPSTGPHARDEARHAGQPLRLAPAKSSAQPLTLQARTTSSPRGNLNSAGSQPRVNPALFPSNPKLAREVFGFAPYWALSGNGNWDYSLLSTIAYFGLDVHSDGSFDTSATNNGFRGWMSQDLIDVINRAHAASDRVVLVIKAFDEGTINAIVSNPAASQNAINWTIQSIRSRNLDGVNVDFEGSTSSSYPNIQSQFSAFVANLSNQVHGAIPGSVVSVDTYSGSASWDGGFMNIGQLAPSVDSLFVMAYDMGFGNLPGQAAPNAPLNGWTYNDTTSVRQYIAKATAAKVILGVPYYGYKYSTANSLPYAAITGGTTADTYSGIVDDFSCAPQLSRNWDSTATSPWASWWSPATNDPCGGNHNSWRELYYDDATSLMAKYDLVNSSDLQGTGMWALGYDGISPDLWQALAVKLRASWAATFDTSAVPQSWAVNQTRTVTIGVTNVGNSTWPAGGNNPVRLGLHFMAAGSIGWLTDQRVWLPADLAPGQSVNLTMSVTAPAAANAVVLQAQMVKEQLFWFKQWANAPVTLQDAIWMATYDVSAIPRVWTYGQTQNFTLTVTNAGNQVWPAGGPNPVHLGLHFAPTDRAGWASWLTDQRFALPSGLAPGQSATLSVSATAPATRGAAVLEAEMVKEQQFWFFQTGPMAVTDAAPAWAAAYDLSQVPHQWTPGQTQTVAIGVTNTGNQTWPSAGSNPVHLGLRFAAGPGQPYAAWLTDQRVALPQDLPPGQHVTISVTLTSPAVGANVLEAQMVKEQQFWFVGANSASIESASASWLATYDLSSVPRSWVAGQPQTVAVTVMNTGNQAWPAGGNNPVHLGLHFVGAAGRPYTEWQTDQRVVLPADLQPGQSVTLSASLTPPWGYATVLEAQMVKEQQFWFVPRGPAPIANTGPTWMAGYDLAQAPHTWRAGQTQTFTVTVLNAGNLPWPSGSANPVRLGVHFADNPGLPYTIWLTDQRVWLPADLNPGQTVALSVTVSAPSGNTGGVLEVEAVKEQQFWFAQRAPLSFLAS